MPRHGVRRAEIELGGAIPPILVECVADALRDVNRIGRSWTGRAMADIGLRPGGDQSISRERQDSSRDEPTDVRSVGDPRYPDIRGGSGWTARQMVSVLYKAITRIVSYRAVANFKKYVMRQNKMRSWSY